MQLYEYTVIPAPGRGEKVRGARTGAERFSYALLTEMNRMAALGWEYIRAETLPCEERSGLTSRTTVYHNVLVFRRAVAPASQHHAAALAAPPAAAPQRAPAARTPAPAPAAPSTPPVLPSAPDDAGQSNWPDGGAASDAETTDRYDEPGFDPQPPASPPAFTRRPPLSAAQGRDSAAGVFSGARLGPAER